MVENFEYIAGEVILQLDTLLRELILDSMTRYGLYSNSPGSCRTDAHSLILREVGRTLGTDSS